MQRLVFFWSSYRSRMPELNDFKNLSCWMFTWTSRRLAKDVGDLVRIENLAFYLSSVYKVGIISLISRRELTLVLPACRRSFSGGAAKSKYPFTALCCRSLSQEPKPWRRIWRRSSEALVKKHPITSVKTI